MTAIRTTAWNATYGERIPGKIVSIPEGGRGAIRSANPAEGNPGALEFLLNLVGTDVVIADTTPDSILAAGDLEISGHGFSVNGYAFDSAMVARIDSVDAGRSSLVVVKLVPVTI